MIRVCKKYKKVNETLKLHTNGGVLISNMKGDLLGYGMVWYHEAAITNILSLSNIKKRRKNEYNSENGDTFVVKVKMDHIINLKQVILAYTIMI